METPRFPTPQPPPVTAVQTSPVEINVATRQIHARLNRLITSRLPLALPPLAQDPGLYTHGLAAFAQVYFAFEDAWLRLRQTPSQAEGAEQEADEHEREQQSRDWLCELVPPGSWRSGRLRADSAVLRTRHGLRTGVQDGGDRGRESKVEEFATRIHEAVERDPVVSVAYAWVMYMAIFSGGRWIRQESVSAGAEFWGVAETTAPLSTSVSAVEANGKSNGHSHASQQGQEQEQPGLSFSNFDGPADGEDIKADFKSRSSRAETILTEEERRRVVREADTIFEKCIAVVEESDEQSDTAARIADGAEEKAYQRALEQHKEAGAAQMTDGRQKEGGKAWTQTPAVVCAVLVAWVAFLAWRLLR